MSRKLPQGEEGSSTGVTMAMAEEARWSQRREASKGATGHWVRRSRREREGEREREQEQEQQ